MTPRARQLSTRYVLPFLCVGIALLVTLQIHVLHDRGSLFAFLVAVAISMRLGNWVSGTIATGLSVLATAFFLMQPLRSFTVADSGDLVKLGIFILACLLVLWLHHSQLKNEKALRRSEQRLMLALDSAHMGVWEYDLIDRRFWWSKTLEAIYGRNDDNFADSYGRFFGYIHFDDQPVFNRAITRTIDEGTDYEVEHRIVLPDKSIRWINTRGRVFFNEFSRAERIVGIATDITHKKKPDPQFELTSPDADETPALQATGV